MYICFCILTYSFICKADPLIKKDDRIWLIGDSNGFLIMQELPSLSKIDGYNLRGNPVGGSSVISWSFQLNKQLCEMNRFHPTVVLVCLGSNDAYMGPLIIKNELPYLNRLLSKLKKDDRKIIWIGPPTLGYKPIGLQAFVDMVRPVVMYIDSRDIKIEMWDDLLHPSFIGRKKWAKWVWEKLTE